MRVIGLGLSSAATAAQLRAALLAAGPADLVAVLEIRATHPALADLPPGLLPALTTVPEAALRDIPTPSRSARVLNRFGTGSVAEALALHLSGGELVCPRQSLGSVTWAIAETPARKAPA